MRALVAHNSEYDLFIVTGESLCIDAPIVSKDSFCTMKVIAPICKLPGIYNDYKQEAFRFAFEKEFDGAHDAMADVRACKDIYFWLQAQKLSA